LETKSIDKGNLNDSVELIDTIDIVRRTQIDDQTRMKQLLDAQRLLERQRYSFPDQWISMETIENSWTSMNDSLKLKEQIVDRQVRYFILLSFVLPLISRTYCSS
jgi:dynein heavy chain 1, cytosolic